jgi:hypothetical protein
MIEIKKEYKIHKNGKYLKEVSRLINKFVEIFKINEIQFVERTINKENFLGILFSNKYVTNLFCICFTDYSFTKAYLERNLPLLKEEEKKQIKELIEKFNKEK